jgi:hypothetical protein
MQLYILTYIGKPFGESGESCKTNYDLTSGCKNCGTGSKIESELHSKGLTKIAKDFFQTNDGDTIISTKLKEEMVRAHIKIGELAKVVEHRGQYLSYYNLTSDFMLPKATKIKGLIVEDQCYLCKQNGYFNDVIVGNIKKRISTVIKPVEIFYNNVDDKFLRQSDVFLSWEHMGKSNLVAHGKFVVRYARPLLIVSELFYDFLTSKGVTNIKVESINLTNK